MSDVISGSLGQSRCVGMPVKKRIRFREEDDIALLREVAGQNPFANPEVWNIIKQHLFLLTGKDFTLKTLKDHLDLIIKLWLERTKINTFKSGTEEDYSEKEQLCQDIYDTMCQFRNKVKQKKSKKKVIENAGKASRDLWANNSITDLKFGSILDTADSISETGVVQETDLPDHEYCNNIAREECVSTFVEEKENVEILPQTSEHSKVFPQTPGQSNVLPQTPRESKVLRPIRARKRKINVQRQGLSYLEQYDKSQVELKKKELILEEQRIALEEKKMVLAEKKFDLEDFERRKKLQILENTVAADVEHKKELNKIIERQDKLIETLLLQLQK